MLTPKENGAGGASVWPHEIEHSALFDVTGEHLTRVPSVLGDQRTFTFNFNIKLSQFTYGNAHFLACGSSTTARFYFNRLTTGGVKIEQSNGLSLLSDDDCLADATGHYNIHLQVDTNQAVATDRVILKINGKRVPLSGTFPSQGFTTWVNTTNSLRIGGSVWYPDAQTDRVGYLSEIYFIDGQALESNEFGEYSALVDGLWVPREYTGSYGTNGFHLDFSDAANLGTDVSGNGNDFTVGGSPVQTVDTPTNNYCTLNAADPNAVTLSNGNLTLTSGTAKPTLQPESGKWSYKKDGIEQLYDADIQGKFNQDLSIGTYTFSGYIPTSGYKSLCAKNLPKPEIMKTSEYADVLLRQGTGAVGEVDSLAFSPDWVTAKRVTGGGGSWHTIDSERDAGERIGFNLDTGEYFDTNRLNELLPNGYSFGSQVDVNALNSLYVDSSLKKDPAAGFDIVRWTGDGTTGRFLNYDLGSRPASVILMKSLDYTQNWNMYHKALGLGAGVTPNAASVKFTDGNTFYSVDASGWVPENTPTFWNKSGREYIAYCFADSDVFKAFSHVGNGSVNGPFVHLGGKPLCILLQKNVDRSTSWLNRDSLNNPFNAVDEYLLPNSLNTVASNPINATLFTSTGFKVAGTGSPLNSNGDLIVGLAIMQSAQKYSNAY